MFILKSKSYHRGEISIFLFKICVVYCNAISLKVLGFMSAYVFLSPACQAAFICIHASLTTVANLYIFIQSNHSVSGKIYHRKIPQGPLLLTWLHLNPSMDRWFIHCKVWNKITYTFPNFNSCTVEVWEWISNFALHFTRHAINFPCWY